MLPRGFIFVPVLAFALSQLCPGASAAICAPLAPSAWHKEGALILVLGSGGGYGRLSAGAANWPYPRGFGPKRRSGPLTAGAAAESLRWRRLEFDGQTHFGKRFDGIIGVPGFRFINGRFVRGRFIRGRFFPGAGASAADWPYYGDGDGYGGDVCYWNCIAAGFSIGYCSAMPDSFCR